LKVQLTLCVWNPSAAMYLLTVTSHKILPIIEDSGFLSPFDLLRCHAQTKTKCSSSVKVNLKHILYTAHLTMQIQLRTDHCNPPISTKTAAYFEHSVQS